VIDDVTSEEKRAVYAIAGAVMDERSHYLPLAPLVMSSEHMELLRRRERPIAREIGEDGIPL
jgi:hypothetical protein